MKIDININEGISDRLRRKRDDILNMTGIDVDLYAANKPFLLNFFEQSFYSPDFDVDLFRNYENTYDAMYEKGMLSFPDDFKDRMDLARLRIQNLPLGDIKTDQAAIKACVSERKNTLTYNGQVLAIDFSTYIELLQRAYHFKLNDLYRCDTSINSFNQRKEIADRLQFSSQQYDEASRSFPAESDSARMLSLANFAYEQAYPIPYCNFWHYIIDNDFKGFRWGSVKKMNRVDPYAHSDARRGRYSFDAYNAIRELIFRDIEATKIFGEGLEEIYCWLEK